MIKQNRKSLNHDFTFKLLPIGENRFGKAGGSVIIDFGENCLVIDGITCKKLQASARENHICRFHAGEVQE